MFTYKKLVLLYDGHSMTMTSLGRGQPGVFETDTS